MTEQSTSLIRNNLPPKYKDQGSPTISIVVGNSKLGHALVDLGESVNLFPHLVYVELGLVFVQHKIVYNQIPSTITQEILSSPKAKVPKTCSPIFVFLMDQNTYKNL